MRKNETASQNNFEIVECVGPIGTEFLKEKGT
jgi:hypothetical protein